MDLSELQAVHKSWIKASFQADERKRESHWTESIASGSKSFIKEVKQSLGFKAKGKSITGSNDHYQLRKDVAKFGNTSLYGPEPIVRSDAGTTNTILWRNYS